MATCPLCRKTVDPLATRCRHCGGEIQLPPAMAAESTYYTAVVAPALGAALMSVIFCILSPFSGLALNFALGRATDLTFLDYMVGFHALIAVVLISMGLSAFCGWLRQRIDSLALSLLSFSTPLIVPPVLIVAFQIAGITNAA